MTITKNTVLYAKDVMIITGKSERTAQRKLYLIRKQLGLPRLSYITIDQYSEHTGFKSETIIEVLRNFRITAPSH